MIIHPWNYQNPIFLKLDSFEEHRTKKKKKWGASKDSWKGKIEWESVLIFLKIMIQLLISTEDGKLFGVYLRNSLQRSICKDFN